MTAKKKTAKPKYVVVGTTTVYGKKPGQTVSPPADRVEALIEGGHIATEADAKKGDN